jgi:hypothetical protein
MQRKVVLSLAVLLCLATAAQATSTIIVGNHILQPGMAGQVIQIFVDGDGSDQVQGVNFRAQLGDGGPGVGGTTDIGPMTGNLLPPGSVFDGNNNGVTDGSAPPSYVDLQTTTQGTSTVTIIGHMLLAELTFDTTGFTSSDVIPLILSNTFGGVTDFSGVPIIIEDGSVQIVPEPSSVVLGLFGLAGLGAVVIRKRRVRA